MGERTPLELWELHAASRPGDVVAVDATGTPWWALEGAGLEAVDGGLRRVRTIADTTAPGMRLLLVGLNPSPAAADAGVGFFRAGNRFWPAALAAGIVTRDRDPRHALGTHGVGMTDLVKRTTARAEELSVDEYRHGLSRIEALAEALAPAVVCFVGLAGWRAAVDRRATTGWQDRPVGGRPTYVMPNPSGLNAHVRVDDLAGHLRAAAAGPA